MGAGHASDEPDGTRGNCVCDRSVNLCRPGLVTSSKMDADIRVLGCDDASVNTERHAGICRLFELWKRQLVHWYIHNQLHENELNLREAYVKLDGITTGPKLFSGPISKMVVGAVETSPVVDFTRARRCRSGRQ